VFQIRDLVLLALLVSTFHAQPVISTLIVSVQDPGRRPAPDISLRIVTPDARLERLLKTDSRGQVRTQLPPGSYGVESPPGLCIAHIQVSGPEVAVNIMRRPSTATQSSGCRARPELPTALSVTDIVFETDATVLTEPPYSGGFDSPRGMYSRAGLSWTGNRFSVEGMDITDPYQAGIPTQLPSPELISDARLVTPADAPTISGASSDLRIDLKVPTEQWHFGASLIYSSSGLVLGYKKEAPAGMFDNLGRGSFDLGGPLNHRVRALLSANLQPSAQRLAYSNTAQVRAVEFSTLTRGTAKLGDDSQLDTLFLASGYRRSGWTLSPYADLSSAADVPNAYSLTPQLAVNDSGWMIQTGFTGRIPSGEPSDVISLRVASTQSIGRRYPVENTGEFARLDLTNTSASGTPLAWAQLRRKHQEAQVNAFVERSRLGGLANRLAIGAVGAISEIRNNIYASGSPLLVYAAGVPAFVIQPQTPSIRPQIPALMAGLIQTLTWNVRDGVSFSHWLRIDAALLGDSWKAHSFTPHWASVSPRISLGAPLPLLHHRAVVRTSYARIAYPLAGVYLDYGDITGLGILKYAWNGAMVSGQPERGLLLARSSTSNRRAHACGLS